MSLSFVNSKERRVLVEELQEMFGISKLSPILLETGKSKIRGFSGSMNKEELEEFSRLLRVEVVGLYLVRKEENITRLSMDACQLFGKEKQITKNVFELNDEQAKDWIRRKDIIVKLERGVYVVKHKGDFISCGVSNGEKLLNFIPKERSVRSN